MVEEPLRYTRSDTLFPYTTHCRAYGDRKIRCARKHREVGFRDHQEARPVPQLVIEIARELDEQLLGKAGPGSFVRDGQQHFLAGTTAIEFFRTDDATDAVIGRQRARSAKRSEERRVGKECVGTCRSRGSPYH